MNTTLLPLFSKQIAAEKEALRRIALSNGHSNYKPDTATAFESLMCSATFN